MREFLLFCLFICLLTSCSGYKEISYFQDIDEKIEGKFNTEEISKPLIIREDDELSIIVSAEDPQVAAPFNLSTVLSPSNLGLSNENKIGQAMTPTSTIQTYLVDSNGEIHFPVLGKIKLVGMTVYEATAYLEERIQKYIKNPIINIRIINFKISVLGEVNMPGTFSYNNQKVSILDAIASAKDLTTHGLRDNILIIREDEGKKEYFRFDLTKTDMFYSPNFYLQQNDIVYILPNKEKQRDASSGVQKQFNLTVITASIGTIISILAIALSR